MLSLKNDKTLAKIAKTLMKIRDETYEELNKIQDDIIIPYKYGTEEFKAEVHKQTKIYQDEWYRRSELLSDAEYAINRIINTS